MIPARVTTLVVRFVEVCDVQHAASITIRIRERVPFVQTAIRFSLPFGLFDLVDGDESPTIGEDCYQY